MSHEQTKTTKVGPWIAVVIASTLYGAGVFSGHYATIKFGLANEHAVYKKNTKAIREIKEKESSDLDYVEQQVEKLDEDKFTDCAKSTLAEQLGLFNTEIKDE